MSQEVDAWIIVKPILSSIDEYISIIAKHQLTETITSAVGYILNIWTRTRHSVNPLGIRIDISDGNIKII